MNIQGITIQLINKIRGGVDGFNRPIETDAPPIDVHNVLVGEPSPEEITTTLNLYGKVVRYTLGIPKGDTNTWEGDVLLWGVRYHIVDAPTQGIEANIPLAWNKKVHVEAYPAPEDLKNNGEKMESMDRTHGCI